MNRTGETNSSISIEQLVHKLSVYVVTDEREDIDEQLRIIEMALQGGATTIQLRRKREDGRALVEYGHRIRELTYRYNALYIVNDRVDVALLTDADGVHVGQSDISCRDARQLVGDRIVGVSARTLNEARTAFEDGADYIGAGAIFTTPSKEDAVVCGLSGLEEIAKEVPQIPIVAIGGINLENASDVLSAGADGLAVVSAIMQAVNPASTSLAFHALIEKFTRKRATF